jgi:hypothetical protein
VSSKAKPWNEANEANGKMLPPFVTPGVDFVYWKLQKDI